MPEHGVMGALLDIAPNAASAFTNLLSDEAERGAEVAYTRESGVCWVCVTKQAGGCVSRRERQAAIVIPPREQSLRRNYLVNFYRFRAGAAWGEPQAQHVNFFAKRSQLCDNVIFKIGTHFYFPGKKMSVSPHSTTREEVQYGDSTTKKGQSITFALLCHCLKNGSFPKAAPLSLLYILLIVIVYSVLV